METWNSSCILCAEYATYTWKLIANPPQKKSWLLLFQMNSKSKKAKYWAFPLYTSAWNQLVIGAVVQEVIGKLKYFVEWKANRNRRLCVPVWPSWSCLEPESCVFSFCLINCSLLDIKCLCFFSGFFLFHLESKQLIYFILYGILGHFVISSNVKLGALASTSFQKIAIFYLTMNAIL